MTWDLGVTFSVLDAVAVAKLSGRLWYKNSVRLAAELDGAIDRTGGRLVLDMSGVDYVSSAGLKVLDEAASRCRAGGGLLVLAAPTEPVQITFDLGGLASRVPVEPSLEAAVARALSGPGRLESAR